MVEGKSETRSSSHVSNALGGIGPARRRLRCRRGFTPSRAARMLQPAVASRLSGDRRSSGRGERFAGRQASGLRRSRRPGVRGTVSWLMGRNAATPRRGRAGRRSTVATVTRAIASASQPTGRWRRTGSSISTAFLSRPPRCFRCVRFRCVRSFLRVTALTSISPTPAARVHRSSSRNVARAPVRRVGCASPARRGRWAQGSVAEMGLDRVGD